MELDADEPRKFQGPPDRILGQPTWFGGEQNFGYVWRRDVRELGLFGAEANLTVGTQWYGGCLTISQSLERPLET